MLLLPWISLTRFPGAKDSANLADTERNERQAFKRQQFSAAKSEMAYHNHFVLNSLGGNPKSAMPVLSLCPFPLSFPFVLSLCPFPLSFPFVLSLLSFPFVLSLLSFPFSCPFPFANPIGFGRTVPASCGATWHGECPVNRGMI
jgi:hypothetical protein